MRSNHINEDLLGYWVLKHEDQNAVEEYGQVMLKFNSDGILTYTIFEEEKEKVILLIYEISGDRIITTQPSTENQKEITKYEINDRELTLTFQGNLSTYIKLSDL